MAIIDLPGTIENITYSMQIPYCGCFDWNYWIIFLLTFGLWIGILVSLHLKTGMSPADRLVYSIIFVGFSIAIYESPVISSITFVAGQTFGLLFIMISVWELGSGWANYGSSKKDNK